MKSFADSAKAHLTQYKRTILGVNKDGLWVKDGKSRPHILPSDLREMNVLEPYRNAFWRYAHQSTIHLHRDFHHLTSSQAMAFNLFFPALTEGALANRRIVQALTGREDDIRAWAFEAVPDPTEGTNVDLLLDLASNGKVFVELKFTESRFGTAKADERHRNKLRDLYRPRLIDKIEPGFLEDSVFLSNYQLLRNISHITSTFDTVAFVVPSRNQRATEHANRVLKAALLPGTAGVRLVTVEDIVDTISNAIVNERFAEHYRLFQEKYVWGDTT